MTIPIYSSNSSFTRINLLEIAGKILKNYKFGETYSIDMEIDFDSHFITDGGDIRDRYYLSQIGNIIDNPYEYEITHEEDSAGVISEEEIKIEARPYSDKEFMKIVSGRIMQGLKSIGGVNINSNIDINKIITTFQIGSLDQIEYRDFLLSLIETEIGALNPVVNIEGMKKGLMNTIIKLSEQFESNIIVLSETDISFVTYSNGRLRNQFEGDSIKIFECYIPYLLKELLIYIFIYEGKIESVKMIDGVFSLLIPEVTSLVKTNIQGPIKFYENNGDVYLNGSKIGSLVVNQIGYMLFKVLYDSQNTLLPSRTIMENGKFKSLTKSDENYIANKLYLIKKQLGDEFIDTYTERINNQYVLWNKPQD